MIENETAAEMSIILQPFLRSFRREGNMQSISDPNTLIIKPMVPKCMLMSLILDSSAYISVPMFVTMNNVNNQFL
jgi:hypothetical protein